jgi:pyruvate formate lyase activating enzyme
MNTDKVFNAVNRDKMFYQASGGGVTVSGGEPLLKPEFICDLFEKCHQAGIHTCIETSGCTSESSLRKVLPNTDYLLYDLKHMNSEKHRQYTGKPNGLILSNAKIVAASGVETLFRMPLIPGINDNSQNIKETAEFLHRLGDNALRIELIPYHRLGKGKYEALDKQYLLSELLSPEPEYLESIKYLFKDNGIICTISR